MQVVSSPDVKITEVPLTKGIGHRREYIGNPGTIDIDFQAILAE